mmetsp:Transcript_106668/g.318876  ORF Transcript_106668/g.318876 Transcript_106668/m.318876 type:complete len:226 (+) Transcript_106668:1259-1936(+)
MPQSGLCPNSLVERTLSLTCSQDSLLKAPLGRWSWSRRYLATPSSCSSESAEATIGEETADRGDSEVAGHLPTNGEASVGIVGLHVKDALETLPRGRPLSRGLGGGCGGALTARQGQRPRVLLPPTPAGPGFDFWSAGWCRSISTTTRYGARSFEESTRASAAGMRSSAAPAWGSGASGAFGVSISTGTGAPPTIRSLIPFWIRLSRSCCRACLSLTFTISSPMK